ncbi:MAG: saccharopine dehydrogenase family protein [Thermoguttaceae bacterium]
MSEQPSWMLYGASGYTGRRIAELARQRGLRPVLAGRDAATVRALAERLDCPARVFPLRRVEAVAHRLHGVRAVLNCAGPFSATAVPMIEACLAAGVHYLDITGEIAVIEAAAARHDRAIAAGVSLIPAVGFDVVPSDCLAAMLAGRLPGAERLELAFRMTGPASPGTVKTMLEALPHGGRVRMGGRIRRVPLAWKLKEIPLRAGPELAVTVPWGDVASAWYTTRIPNIEVYLAMPPWQIGWLRRVGPLLALLRPRFVQHFLRAMVQQRVRGPTPEQAVKTRGSFWGCVTDASGRKLEATLETLGGYPLTAATALAAVERVLAGAAPHGFSTPAKAFGAEFVLGVPGTDVCFESPPL